MDEEKDKPDTMPTWLLVEAEPSDIPAAVRLRRLLKAMLRTYGIRCVKIQTVEPNTKGE